MKPAYLSIGALLALFAGGAAAHSGHAGESLMSGLAHPLLGVDHMLTMLAVGLYAAMQKAGSRWMLPAGFVSAMLAGAGLGALGVEMPLVEGGIAASLLVLGLLLALLVRLPLAAGLPLVASFALFHGHAHFLEMGHQVLASYAAGFALAAAALHAAGFALARWMPESRRGRAGKRLAGGVLAGSGLVLLGT